MKTFAIAATADALPGMIATMPREATVALARMPDPKLNKIALQDLIFR